MAQVSASSSRLGLVAPESATHTRITPKPILEPFTIDISDESIARLKSKLEDTHLPEVEIVEDAGWNYGLDQTWVEEMRTTWIQHDWRQVERKMNS
jgi:hypothetical protein